MREIIEGMEKRRERERDWGREPERQRLPAHLAAVSQKGGGGEDKRHGALRAAVRVALPKVFRHAAKISTARIGDFERPLHPFLAHVAAVAVRHAAEQTTRRQLPAPEACSYEVEVKAIHARYSSAIDAGRRLNKPRHEIDAIIRAIRHQQALDLAALRRRRKARAKTHARQKTPT